MSGEAAVRIQEIDLSARVASFEGVFGAIVVPAKRGSTDRPSLVTNNRQFLDRFTPKGRVEVGYDLSHYSALSYLSRSDKLWVSRAVNGALFGGAAIKSGGSSTSNNPLQSGFAFPESYEFDSQLDVVGRPEVTRVQTVANAPTAAIQQVLETVGIVGDVNESLNGQYLVLPFGGNSAVVLWFNVNDNAVQPVVDPSFDYVEVPVIENANPETVAQALADAIEAFGEHEVEIALSTLTVTNLVGGLQDISPQAAGDASWSFVVEGENGSWVLQNKAFIIHDQDGAVGVWFNVDGLGDEPSLGTQRYIEVALAGGENSQMVANFLRDALDSDSQFTATSLNNLVTISDVNDGERTDASDVDSGFTIEITQQGQSDVNEEDECMLIHGSSEGAFINDIGYRLITHLDDPDLVPEDGSFLIEVYRRDFPGSPIESFFCSRILGKRDGFGRNMYVEDVLQASGFIRALNNDLVDEEIYPKSQFSIQYLGGGEDGMAPTVNQMIQAANKFSNPDEIPVTLLLDGGYATPAYALALDTIAKTRMDCVAILSTRFEDEVSADYLNNLSDYRKVDLNINSSYSALYTPHVRIQDQFNDREIFIAPDGFVGGSISLNANAREIWFPPAGYRRGVLDVLGVSRIFESGERSLLYNIGINPIKSTPGRGIVIWGQKTLLTRPSLLNRLNVRLLLIVISPAIKEFLEDYLFEINDRITRSEVEERISEYLRDIQSRRGLTRFQVICDETNNPSQVIDNQRMVVDVLLTPTSSIEDIPLRIVIVSNATSFGDAAQAI